MNFLEKQAGPDCPRCGCNACSLMEVGTWHGKPYARFECDYCSQKFQVGQHVKQPRPGVVNGVRYIPVRCPTCESKNTHVTSSGRANAKPRVRFHRCDACGQNFKSVEK